jgi:hypothetical protein
MKARIIMTNANLPMVQAVTTNGIAIAFKPPDGVKLHLSDELEIDLECDGG